MGYAGPGQLGGGLEWGSRCRHCLDPGAPGQTATPPHPFLLCLPWACCVTPGQAALSELPWTHSQPLPCPQATWSTPTARQPTAARHCPARWPWSTTALSSRGGSECGLWQGPGSIPWWGSGPGGPTRTVPALTALPPLPWWFCHVDDDNYVNVRALLRLLGSYPHTQDVYLGKPSLDRPIQATERVSENKVVSVPPPTPACTASRGGGWGCPAAWQRGSGSLTTSPRPHSVLSTSGLPLAGLASASAEDWP